MVKRSATRAYDSPLRRAQAAQTRRGVLDAARAAFLEHGYGPTTIRDIAARAGVSAETVYATFGSKRALLQTLIDVAIAGDDAPMPILERPWVGRLRASPGIRARLRILAREGARILERRAPIDAIVRSAAATDPRLAALQDELLTQRHAGQRALLRLVIGTESARLRAGMTEARAADVLAAIGSPETWHTLVRERGWTSDGFAAWYTDALERLLLR